MTHAEKLKEIWRSKNTPIPFLMRGLTPEEKKGIIDELTDIIFNKLIPLIPKPKDGKTPTREEILELIQSVLPTKNDLQNLISPLIPKPKDGKTPTQDELLSIIKPLIPQIRDGEDGHTPTKSEIEDIVRPILVEYLNTLPKPKEVTQDDLVAIITPMMKTMVAEAKKGWFGGGGGGDNVRAGSGITITTNNVGAKVISASGGGVVELTATGTVNGTNTNFIFTEEPTYIVSDGAKYKKNAGWSWNSGTLTVTMIIPPQYSIWGEK